MLAITKYSSYFVVALCLLALTPVGVGAYTYYYLSASFEAQEAVGSARTHTQILDLLERATLPAEKEATTTEVVEETEAPEETPELI